MSNTGNTTKMIVGAMLASVVVFTVFLSANLYQQIRKMENRFNKEKAALIKEGMDLQDRIDILNKELKEKSGAAVVIEDEKKKIVDMMESMKDENRQVVKQYLKKIGDLKKENIALNDRLEAAEKLPLDQLLKQAAEKEDNEAVRKLLENVVSKIEMIRQGKSVNLEPIVVTAESPAQAAGMQGAQGISTKTAKIISADKANNLIVVDIGRNQSLKEGQGCSVLKDDKEIASGQVISTRYKISAVFIDEIKYGYTINDINEGDKVYIKGD